MLLEVIPVLEIKDDSALVNVSELVSRFPFFLNPSTPPNPKSFMEQDETGRMEGQTEGWKSIDF